MRMWETTDAFPFKTLRGLGGALLTFGIILIGLGAFDVIWTVVYYTDDYKDCPDRSDWDSELSLPCDHDDLVWTWTAEGIWGGFLVLVIGILGLLFSRWRVRNLRLMRDMFGVGCIILIFPICPAIITLSVLELYYGNDIFYHEESNELMVEDYAKFVVPLLVGFFAFLAWLIAIAGASVACCCAEISIQETVYGDKQPIVATPQGPQQQQLVPVAPAVQQQPQTQYEIVAIAQPPPPPFFISAPLGAPPPPPHMLAGPPPPHMMGPPPHMMGPPGFGPPPPGFGPPPFRPPRGYGPPMLPPPEAYL